jgi:outer membrane protein assembly factor BamB
MSMNAATPIVDGQTVIIAINGHKALKIEKEGEAFAAKELWNNPDVTAAFSTPLVRDGAIFGISNRGNIYCLDEKTGTLKWTGQDSLGRMGFGSIVDAGSALIALAPPGELRVVNPSGKEYSEVAKIKVAETETYAHPVLANNRLLIKDKDSVISYSIE